MGRKAKYEWDKWLVNPTDTVDLPYEDHLAIRASLVQWARSRNKKVVTKRMRKQDTWGGLHEHYLLVTLIGDKDANP